MHFTAPSFWVAYDALPKRVQRIADRRFKLLQQDPRHPSLHFKTVGKYWSARVDCDYRVLGLKAEDGLVWFWIGLHQE